MVAATALSDFRIRIFEKLCAMCQRYVCVFCSQKVAVGNNHSIWTAGSKECS